MQRTLRNLERSFLKKKKRGGRKEGKKRKGKGKERIRKEKKRA